MDWTPQQEAALAAVGRWLANPGEPIFRLFGYAGTGKTTLARHLAGSNRGLTLFAAYTGKAALVMRRAGCADASTIHSLIYQPYEEGAGRREAIAILRLKIAETDDPAQRSHMQKELDELENAVRSPNRPKPSFMLRYDSDLRRASLLVVDEASMVDENMARDLMSFGTPILVLGDPAQLPPVKGEGFFTAAKPDAMLTDVQRQAKDNPIIAMATSLREKGELPLQRYGDSEVMCGRPSPEEALNFSQMIVGLNRTRRNINSWARKQMGRTDFLPKQGDRLICLRNDREEGLLNGGMWVCGADAEDDDPYVRLSELRDDDSGRVVDDLKAHRHIFTGEERRLAYWDWREAQEFDYAYAITCHKSQGSQWPSVAVFDEWFSDGRKQWLYTAITRAQDRVAVYRR